MKRALSLFVAVGLLSCGLRNENKSNTSQQEKKAFFAKVETPQVPENVVKEAYANLPDTTGLLVRIKDPWKLVSTFYQLAKRVVAAEDIAEFEKMATAEAGFNILDPKAVSETAGIDFSKPIDFFIDNSLIVPIERKDPFSETVTKAETPTFIFQGTLSNTEKFLANAQLIASKEPKTRLVTADENGAKFAYLYQQKSYYEEIEVVRAAFAIKDNAIKVIVLPEGVNLGASEESMKKAVIEYSSRQITKPLSEDPTFKLMTAHADPTGDMFMYANTTALAVLVERLTSTIQKDETITRQIKETVTKVVTSFPGFASSTSFTEKGLRGTGVVKLVHPGVSGMRNILPTKDSPAYGSIFPEGIDYFSRHSTNFLGMKDYLMYLVPKEYVSTVEQQIAMVNSMLALYAPLNIETDILGAFSGNLAYGMDYSSLILTSTSGVPPKFFLVAQLSDEKAGDKLLSVIAELPQKFGAPVSVATQDVAGEKLYSFAEGPVEVAWGRCGDVLVFGFGIQAVKDIYGRIKTPGASSFVDKSGSEFAKSMVNAKSGSGAYIDAGEILMSVLAAPGAFADPKAKEIIAKIAPLLGPIVSQSNYNPETQLDVSIIEMNFK